MKIFSRLKILPIIKFSLYYFFYYSYGKCVCNNGYSLSKQYMPLSNKFWFYSKYRSLSSLCYQCECKPNFRYSTTSGKYEQFKCKYDSDCHDYDYHRVCRFDDCKCEYGFPERWQSMTCGSNNSYLTFSLIPISISIIIYHLFNKI